MTSIIRADNISTVAGTGTIALAAGNTLDASAGFTPPAGHLVQTTQTQAPYGSITVSSTTFTAVGHEVAIVPKYTNSQFIIRLTGGGWYDNGFSMQSLWVTFQRSVDGGAYAYTDNSYYNNYGLLRMSGDGNTWNIKPYSAEVIDSPSAPAGSEIIYRVVARVNQNSCQYQATDRGAPTLTVQEIKA